MSHPDGSMDIDSTHTCTLQTPVSMSDTDLKCKHVWYQKNTWYPWKHL